MSVDIKYSSTFDMLNQAVHSLNMCNLTMKEILSQWCISKQVALYDPLYGYVFNDSAIWVWGGYELNMTPLEKH